MVGFEFVEKEKIREALDVEVRAVRGFKNGSGERYVLLKPGD